MEIIILVIHAHNKVLVKSCAQFYHEHWKRRCVVLHNPEVQRNVLQEDLKVIMLEENKKEIEGLRRYLQMHTINSNIATLE